MLERLSGNDRRTEGSSRLSHFGTLQHGDCLCAIELPIMSSINNQSQFGMQQVSEQLQGAAPPSNPGGAAPATLQRPQEAQQQREDANVATDAPPCPPGHAAGGGGGSNSGGTASSSSGMQLQQGQCSSGPAAAPACSHGKGCSSRADTPAAGCAPQHGGALASACTAPPAVAGHQPIEVASPVCYAGQFTDYTGVAPH